MPQLLTQLRDVFGDERGQTLNDFGLAIGLFLLTLMFTFTFMNSLVTPYESAGDDGTDIRAERITTTLIDRTFMPSPYGRQPTTLNTTCTVAFFANASHAGCPYNPSPLNETFTVKDGDQLYVAITDQSGTPVTVSGTTLERGRRPYQQASSVVNERIVYVNGNTRVLRVVVK